MLLILRGGFFGFLALAVLALFLPKFGLSWMIGFTAAALVCLILGIIPWENLSAPQFAPHAPRAQAQPRQGPGAFDGLGATLKEHGWLIGGFAFAIAFVITVVVAWNSVEKATPVILSAAFFLASLLCFLVSAGALKGFLQGWVEKFLPATLVVLSLAAAFGFGWAAWDERSAPFSELAWFLVGLVVALAVALFTVLFMLDMLGAFFLGFARGTGKLFMILFGFQYHAYLSIAMWALVLMAGGTFMLVAAKHDLFDSSVDLEAVLWEPMRIAIGVGFTLLVIGLLVFKKK
jgi:hypothetical protein